MYGWMDRWINRRVIEWFCCTKKGRFSWIWSDFSIHEKNQNKSSSTGGQTEGSRLSQSDSDDSLLTHCKHIPYSHSARRHPNMFTQHAHSHLCTPRSSALCSSQHFAGCSYTIRVSGTSLTCSKSQWEAFVLPRHESLLSFHREKTVTRRGHFAVLT